jgi:hypothetical protein
MEASYFQQEKVLEYPGCRDLMDDIELVPDEFVVEENLNYGKEVVRLGQAYLAIGYR